MKTIAIIPARGGSKRIPHKNIIDFMGKPLIVWTIGAAKESGLFDRIIVSTDNLEIAEIAKEAGIDVPFFRQEANDDITPISRATIAAVKQAEKHWAEEYDVVVQLMANCPLRGCNEIIRSYNHFIADNTNFQISCFKFGWMNPWWAVKLGEDFKPDPLFPDVKNTRSQDLPELFCPTGAIWIAKTKELIKQNSFYGQDHILYPIDWKEAVDIDNYEDLEFAKALFIYNNKTVGNNHE